MSDTILPSRKFIITTAILIVIAITIGIFVSPSARKTSNRETGNSADLQTERNIVDIDATLEIDSDSDGLLDWEEALWKTNPFNPDSNGNGINDGEEVRKIQEQNPTTEPETLTESDILARQLYTALAVAEQEDGTIPEESTAQFSKTLEQIALQPVLDFYFTVDNLSVVSATEENLGIYAENFANQFSDFPFPLEKVQSFLESYQNEEDMMQYQEEITKLNQIVEYLKNEQVPSDASLMHVDLLNSLTELSTSLNAMMNDDSDPLVLFRGVSQLPNTLERFEKALDETISYFTFYEERF